MRPREAQAPRARVGARGIPLQVRHSQWHHKNLFRCNSGATLPVAPPPIAAGPERSGGTPAIGEGQARAGEAEHAFGVGIKINMQGRIYDPAIGRFISADPYVQYPLWSQGLNRYSYGFNNPMSGTDPTGFSWFNDAFSDSSGWEVAGAVGGFGSIVAVGAFASGNGSAAAGASGGNEVGGALGLANAVAGLSDPGANRSFAEPMGELGSGAEVGQGSGLYNEGAGAAPPGSQGTLACHPECSLNPSGEFSSEEQWQRYAGAYLLVGDAISLAEGALSLGRWLLGRSAARAGAEALKLGRFKMTQTVANHAGDIVKKGPFKGELARPYLNSPHTVEQILKAGKGVPDPGGVAGALRWDVPGTFRGSQGTWELVMKGDTILHFNFVTP